MARLAKILAGGLQGVAQGIQVGKAYNAGQSAGKGPSGTPGKAAGPGLPAGAEQTSEGAPERIMGRGKKGGRIEKTGVYQLHKGEIVIPERLAKGIGKVGKRKVSRKTTRKSSR